MAQRGDVDVRGRRDCNGWVAFVLFKPKTGDLVPCCMDGLGGMWVGVASRRQKKGLLSNHTT